jgi:anti-sigma factor RsiW
MNCPEVRAQLEDWADALLPPERRRQIEAHLASCADCRARAVSAQRLAALLSQVAPETPPTDLAQRVILATQARAASQARSRRRWQLLGQALTAVGLVLLLLSAAQLVSRSLEVDLLAVADGALNWLEQAIAEPLAALSALVEAGLGLHSGVAESAGLLLTLALVTLAVVSFIWLRQSLEVTS